MADERPGKDEVRRALGLSREALDALEAFRESGRPVTPNLIARALEALLRGNIALLQRSQPAPSRDGDAAARSASPPAESPRKPRAEEEPQPPVFEIHPIPPDALEESGDLDMADLEKVERFIPKIEAPPPRLSRRRTPEGGVFKASDAPVPEHTPPPIETSRSIPTPPPAETPAPPLESAPALPAEPGAPKVREAVEAVRAEALAAFPLEEMNRWLSSGTIFQIRGALAYLNLRSMGGARTGDLRANIRRMGFADELGKLVAEGVAGEVLLFRKPV